VRRLLCMVLLGAAAGAGAATLDTSLEPRLIDEMETTRLIVRAEGGSGESPDLTPLRQDFEILGSQTSSQFRSINGQTSAWTEYQITLRPKRTGSLTVPSIRIGNDVSEEITLNVRSIDPTLKQTIDAMVFFETELSVDPVYVQAETVLTRRLYYSNGVQIYSDLPGAPEVADAVVVPLGDTRSRTEVRGGQRYGVIEQRFALYPESSGELLIPEIAVTASVRLQSGGRIRRSGIRVASEPLKLRVLSIPDAYPHDQSWLPATGLEIRDRWQPDTLRAEVGEPLSRELEVVIRGNSSSAIPPVLQEPPADGIKIYPETPRLSEDSSGDTLVGRRLQSYALVPTRPGPLTIAGTALTWWDTRTGEVRQTRSPGRRIDISGTAVTTARGTEASAAVPPPAADGPTDAPADGSGPQRPPWWPLGLLLLVALAAAIGGRRWLAAVSASVGPPRAATPQRRWRRARSAVERACAGDSPAAMRHALVDLLAVSLAAPDRAAAAQAGRRHPATAEVLAALDACCFGNGDAPSGEAVTAAARALPKPPRPGPAAALPDLYAIER